MSPFLLIWVHIEREKPQADMLLYEQIQAMVENKLYTNVAALVSTRFKLCRESREV